MGFLRDGKYTYFKINISKHNPLKFNGIWITFAKWQWSTLLSPTIS